MRERRADLKVGPHIGLICILARLAGAGDFSDIVEKALAPPPVSSGRALDRAADAFLPRPVPPDLPMRSGGPGTRLRLEGGRFGALGGTVEHLWGTRHGGQGRGLRFGLDRTEGELDLLREQRAHAAGWADLKVGPYTVEGSGRGIERTGLVDRGASGEGEAWLTRDWPGFGYTRVGGRGGLAEVSGLGPARDASPATARDRQGEIGIEFGFMRDVDFVLQGEGRWAFDRLETAGASMVSDAQFAEGVIRGSRRLGSRAAVQVGLRLVDGEGVHRALPVGGLCYTILAVPNHASRAWINIEPEARAPRQSFRRLYPERRRALVVPGLIPEVEGRAVEVGWEETRGASPATARGVGDPPGRTGVSARAQFRYTRTDQYLEWVSSGDWITPRQRASVDLLRGRVSLAAPLASWWRQEATLEMANVVGPAGAGPVAYLPAVRAGLGAAWTWSAWTLALDWRGQTGQEAGDGGPSLGGFSLVSARVTSPPVGGLVAEAGVDNLLKERYEDRRGEVREQPLVYGRVRAEF